MGHQQLPLVVSTAAAACPVAKLLCLRFVALFDYKYAVDRLNVVPMLNIVRAQVADFHAMLMLHV
jgi:hypothetical protein